VFKRFWFRLRRSFGTARVRWLTAIGELIVVAVCLAVGFATDWVPLAAIVTTGALVFVALPPAVGTVFVPADQPAALPPSPPGVELKFVKTLPLVKANVPNPIFVVGMCKWRITKAPGRFEIDLAELNISGRPTTPGEGWLENGFVLASFEFGVPGGTSARVRGEVTLQDSYGKTHRDRVEWKPSILLERTKPLRRGRQRG
jgi:hypothetical protein